jgi:hypothetical protein
VGAGLVVMTVVVVAVVATLALAVAAVVALALVMVGACFFLPLLASCGSPNGALRDRIMPQYSKGIFHTCMRTTPMPFMAWKL